MPDNTASTSAPFWDQVAQNVSLANVPDFEKPTAAKLQVVPGNIHDGLTIAHTTSPTPFLGMTPGRNNKVYVDDPSQFDQPELDHEVLHKIQEQAGADLVDARGNVNYDYGGGQGLLAMFGRGQSIAKLNDEQQAAALENYMRQRGQYQQKSQAGKLANVDMARMDLLNKAYGPLLRQEQNMAAPKGNIDQPPLPPGPPPAELTGMSPPLPGMGGQTLYATHQQTGHRIMTKDGGKSWQPAQ